VMLQIAMPRPDTEESGFDNTKWATHLYYAFHEALLCNRMLESRNLWPMLMVQSW
jgi:hypothetical protein